MSISSSWRHLAFGPFTDQNVSGGATVRQEYDSVLIDLVQTQTRDGLRLDGAWHESPKNCSDLAFDAFCLIHGTGSNFYSSTFLSAIVDHFLLLGCPGICVNTRGHDGISTAATCRGGKRMGAAYEAVDDCRHDIHAWLDFLAGKNRGRILLVGHSLGAVKAIYAMAQEPHLHIAALAAISPPQLSHAQFAASAQGATFQETYARAESLVEQGHAGSLLDVQLPLPMVITAGSYLEKYGPNERYNYLKFLRSVRVPTLVIFGGQEIESNMAFQGGPEAVGALAAVERRIQVEIVAGADHFYTGKRPELLQALERWLRNSANPEPRIEDRDLESFDVAHLLSQAQMELRTRYPDDDPHPRQAQAAEFRPPAGGFVAVWLGDHFVGCGGIRRWDERTAEVKRMFVEPGVRRRGVGRMILQNLEKKAREIGYGMLRLETGQRQPEAIALYEQAGFRRIPAYGEFMSSALSVCFEKELG
jgi:GNAT superfamily N-acetyltransferase/pimeloyl-ACP methyl ester carboxylesterase